jgi:CheY-like chemotaxis protein
MPVRSGFEATALIRKYEMEHGLSPVPIVALTAHAMIGYRVIPTVNNKLTFRKNVLKRV